MSYVDEWVIKNDIEIVKHRIIGYTIHLKFRIFNPFEHNVKN